MGLNISFPLRQPPIAFYPACYYTCIGEWVTVFYHLSGIKNGDIKMWQYLKVAYVI